MDKLAPLDEALLAHTSLDSKLAGEVSYAPSVTVRKQDQALQDEAKTWPRPPSLMLPDHLVTAWAPRGRVKALRQMWPRVDHSGVHQVLAYGPGVVQPVGRGPSQILPSLCQGPPIPASPSVPHVSNPRLASVTERIRQGGCLTVVHCRDCGTPPSRRSPFGQPPVMRTRDTAGCPVVAQKPSGNRGLPSAGAPLRRVSRCCIKQDAGRMPEQRPALRGAGAALHGHGLLWGEAQLVEHCRGERSGAARPHRRPRHLDTARSSSQWSRPAGAISVQGRQWPHTAGKMHRGRGRAAV